MKRFFKGLSEPSSSPAISRHKSGIEKKGEKHADNVLALAGRGGFARASADRVRRGHANAMHASDRRRRDRLPARLPRSSLQTC